MIEEWYDDDMENLKFAQSGWVETKDWIFLCTAGFASLS
jgi:hypothetical protein